MDYTSRATRRAKLSEEIAFELKRASEREDALRTALRNLLTALAEDDEKALSEAIYYASKEAL